MNYRKPGPKALREARVETIKKELKTMLEDEFLQRRTFHDSYSPYMCEKILQVGETGGGRSQMMKTLNVRTVQTFNKWLTENTEFKDAYELAQIYCQAFLEDLLLKKSTGENEAVDPKALNILMAARFPEYKKEAATRNEVNISVTEVTKLDDQTLTERIAYYQRKFGLKAPETIDGECIEVKN